MFFSNTQASCCSPIKYLYIMFEAIFALVDVNKLYYCSDKVGSAP